MLILANAQRVIRESALCFQATACRKPYWFSYICLECLSFCALLVGILLAYIHTTGFKWQPWESLDDIRPVIQEAIIQGLGDQSTFLASYYLMTDNQSWQNVGVPHSAKSRNILISSKQGPQTSLNVSSFSPTYSNISVTLQWYPGPGVVVKALRY
jgi:hypothetical protein